jgi:hypothetical protein
MLYGTLFWSPVVRSLHFYHVILGKDDKLYLGDKTKKLLKLCILGCPILFKALNNLMWIGIKNGPQMTRDLLKKSCFWVPDFVTLFL